MGQGFPAPETNQSLDPEFPAYLEPARPTYAASPAEPIARYYERVGYVVMAVIAALVCAVVAALRALS